MSAHFTFNVPPPAGQTLPFLVKIQHVNAKKSLDASARKASSSAIARYPSLPFHSRRAVLNSMFSLTRDMAQGFVTIATEVAPNISRTVHKVITNAHTMVQQIAGDSASTAFKVAGDITCTGTKIVDSSVGTFAKVRSDVAGTANKIANDASDSLLDTAITSIPSKALYDGL
ncbi:hypothetical protein BGZ61DRAFT_477970 [Ilyonectria robusta]|uniref:uncharacterized protein n=1 Tax=Ilyonectria robusta TaxID=1079257 RepID=UPI001E8CA7D4|nr:uncharacterized protein BGZ61DRAFT_477970 [Ilyonectria robusta]KAH8694351.1 hypothetical protein BGZ61DRAFT_477970 [Ilyonectria robusta]